MLFLSRLNRLCLTLIFGLLSSMTHAEIYDVSTTAELRASLASAAEAGPDNTIRLAAGTYSTQDDGLRGLLSSTRLWTASLLLRASQLRRFRSMGLRKRKFCS